MRLSMLVILFFAVSMASAEQEASFDCSKAVKLSEQLICGSYTLKELDSELAKKYGNSPSDADKRVQRAWIKERDKCLDKVCLERAYRKRIIELNRQRMAEFNRQGIVKYPFLPSLIYYSNDQLCEKVLNKHLNDFFESGAKSEPQEMTWENVEKYGDVGYVELKFDNKSMFLAQFWSCCLSNNELYQSALFSSKDAFWDLNGKNRNEVKSAIKDRGIEIAPNGNIIKIDKLSDIPIETSQFSAINPFEYKWKYYFENKNVHLWNIGEQKVTTLQILENGDLKPVCVVQVKDEKENLLLKKKDFAKFLNLLADMNGGAESHCDGSGRYRQVISYVAVPKTINQVSYTPWKDFDLDVGGMEYGYVKRQAPYVHDFITSWAYDGIYNYDIYQQYNDVKNRARNDLVQYYKEEFGVNEKKAKEWADTAYDKILSSHFAISSSYGYFGDNIRTLLLKGASVDEIEPLLVGNWTRKERNIQDYDNWLHNNYEPTLFYSLKHPNLVKLLLEKGANVNDVNDFNKTALMYAAQFNLYESAKILLDNGINVNAAISESDNPFSCLSIGTYGVSALHYAVRYADIGFIKLLLDNGADKGLKDTSGKTPLDWLETYKNKNLQNSMEEVKKLLSADSS
ncbi:MAG: ankyrin repeat domain-containing protein [Campylobacteraceae bacterium]|jgi:uncharacterized protein YecT (DUF1311 family)|nr:ankyrin repeat domain-containing protein [Campylobacteraceae bacterium]